MRVMLGVWIVVDGVCSSAKNVVQETHAQTDAAWVRVAYATNVNRMATAAQDSYAVALRIFRISPMYVSQFPIVTKTRIPCVPKDFSAVRVVFAG